MPTLPRVLIAGLLAAALGPGILAAGPTRHVLVLHSFGLGIEPYDTLADAFRSTLTEEAEAPIELHEISLETALFSGAEAERSFVEYLRTLDTRRRLDLVVTVGGPAAEFIQRNRTRVFAATPLLIAGVDERRVHRESLRDLDAVVTVRFDVAGIFANIFNILPTTREVVAVVGVSPIERYWAGEFEREFRPFTARAHLTILQTQPFREIIAKVGALPPNAAVFVGMFAQDAEGISHQGDSALSAIRAEAKAPVFGAFDTQLGKGIVGGALLPLRGIGTDAARAALRLLHGAAPATIRPAPIHPGAPAYDWRELVRWNVDPAALPPGSEIRFRTPSAWQRNRWTILGATAVVLAESALILVLLASLTGRRRAEESLRKSRELYALAVDGANDGLWDWNVTTGEVYFSARCKGMLGYGPDELADRYEAWDERIHRDDRDTMLDSLESHLDGTTAAFRVEHRLRHKDGGYRWILARGKAQRDAHGVPYRMAGSLTDITELKAAEEAMRDVSRRLILAQEDERARLARELHDDVTQRLARLAIDAGRLELDPSPTAAGPTLTRVRQDLVRLSEDVHSLSYRLHPSLLEDLGLADALQVECDRFSSVASIPAELDLRGLPDPIPPGVAICLFRVAQEALRNVGRHAGAASVKISLRRIDSGLELAIRDDGIGFDPHDERRRQTLGQASMRERIRLVGGEIDIDSTPGQGTTVLAWVPLDGLPA